MEKVHVIKWAATGRIDSVYSDYKKACRIAKNSNKSISAWQRMSASIDGRTAKWVVQTFDVKD